jgi:hypothetical protein
MSLLLDIANRADVPLEGVVRVLTREPVSEDVKARVLAVIDQLDAEQSRVLQRFALAAVHDILPRSGDEDFLAEFEEGPLELPEAVRFELEPPPGEELAVRADDAPVQADASSAAAFDPAPLVQLGSVLGELTDAVRELRHETDAERRERVDDLAVLIDLITKGWQGVDRRLGRLERQVGRLEPGPAPRPAPVPVAIEPPPPPVPPPDPPPPPPDAADDGRTSLRERLPLIAALAFGIALGVLAALDLPTRFDASAVITESGGEASADRAAVPVSRVPQPPARRAAPPTSTSEPETAPSKRAAPKRQAPTAAPTTTATTTEEPAQEPAPETETETPARPPATTAAEEPATTEATAPTTTTAAKPPPSVAPGFRPSRNWAWPPVGGADYYLVEFFRGGQPLFSSRPAVPRLTLPERVEFVPGFYRWRVRAGHGDPAANQLDPPIVDSMFEVER